MFADALEVEENFRLSGRVPDQSGNNGNRKRMKHVELHETKEEFPWELTPFSSRQRENQYGDENTGCFTIFVPGDCTYAIANCVHDSPEKYFGAPIYDEYEDDYWGGMPKETNMYPVNPRPNRDVDKFGL